MKIEKIIDISELNLKDALGDETLFVLQARHQSKAYGGKPEDPESYPKELRCSCRPICYMTAKSLKELYEKPHDFVVIKIDPGK